MSDAYTRAARKSARIQIIFGLVVVCTALAFVDWRLSLGFFGLYVLGAGNAYDISISRGERRAAERADEMRRNRRVEL